MYKSMLKQQNGKGFIFILLLLFSLQSYANTGNENSYLARIKQVLISLKPLINKAEQSSDKNSRLQFQYPKLRVDIAKIERGIQQKINESNIEPRIITPIQGDYANLKTARGDA